MKAVGLLQYLPVENPRAFIDVDIPKPEPRGHDLLVSVRAVSVNPVDTKMRSPRPGEETEPRILGWDASGVVEQTGPDCTIFKTGDEVFYAGSIIRPGCNSELHLVDERIVGRKPATISFAEAAALPLTAITGWEALFDQMKISPDGADAGRSILIIGGAGGAGSIGIQLAKRLARLTVIATASRKESREWCRSLGADLVVDHTADIAGQIRSAGIGIDHVDYLYCANSIEQHLGAIADLIAPKGRICSIVGGSAGVNVGTLFDKSATFSWELMFTRPKYETEDMIEQHRLLDRVSELVDQGVIRTTMLNLLGPLNAGNLRKAHGIIEAGHTVGKVVLEVPGSTENRMDEMQPGT